MKHAESLNALAASGAGIMRGSELSEQAEAHGHYTIQCFDAEGNLKWSDEIENLVTTAGKNDALDKYLSGSAYTAFWYIGLIGATSYTTGPAAGDTMTSHSGWVEDQNYSQANRIVTVFSGASSGSKSLSSPLDFSINATTTIKGCFLSSNNTKGGTSGILYSAGTFTGGDKALSSGDTLRVSYTASM